MTIKSRLLHSLTRRALLKWSGITGASALIPGLPLPGDRPANAPAIPTRPRDASDLPTWTARHPVLYVDDSWESLILMQVLVAQKPGVSIIGLNRPAEALDVIKVIPISLLISNIMMPHINGFEVVESVKNDPATQAIPVVFCTVMGSADIIARSKALGVTDYWTKPFLADDVAGPLSTQLLQHGHWHMPDTFDADLFARLTDPAATQTPTKENQWHGILPAKACYQRWPHIFKDRS